MKVDRGVCGIAAKPCLRCLSVHRSASVAHSDGHYINITIDYINLIIEYINLIVKYISLIIDYRNLIIDYCNLMTIVSI